MVGVLVVGAKEDGTAVDGETEDGTAVDGETEGTSVAPGTVGMLVEGSEDGVSVTGTSVEGVSAVVGVEEVGAEVRAMTRSSNCVVADEKTSSGLVAGRNGAVYTDEPLTTRMQANFAAADRPLR